MGQITLTDSRFTFRFARAASVLAALIAIAACGGGGGGGSGAPASEPTPRPSPVLPVNTPGPSQSTAEIILRNGDTLGDLVVGNIEDASLGTGGEAGVLVTIAGGNQSAVLRRDPDGSYAPLFDPRDADVEFDPGTLSRLRIAPTGEMVFQSGTGLDTDALHLIADGELHTLAGAAPGPVFPEFRILGNVRIGAGGRVAFVGGGESCQVETGNEAPRITCTNSLYIGDASGDMRLEDETFQLAQQRPSAIRVELDPMGGAWFSLPRRATAPTLVRHADGETTTILTGESQLPGVGAMNAVEAVAINASGEVLLEGGLLAFEGERRPQILGLLRGDSFATIAKEGTEFGGANVATLRGLALDASGQALFEAELGAPDAPATQITSLLLGNEAGLIEIAREGATFPGEDLIVLRILGSRLNAAGDVAFITELGTSVDGVVRRQEVRATVRRADGQLVNVASSRHTGQFGTLSSLQIVGFDDEGTLMMIATRSRASDRVLLLGRSDQAL